MPRPPGADTLTRCSADRLDIDPRVAAALRDRRPVVALESTLISHGLPYPQNLEVARAAEAAVVEAGATPATIAIHAGRVLVGLGQDDLEALAKAPAGSVVKAARPNLAAALSAEGWAATTVSATMIAAAAARIDVFATGGIGGVHRGGSTTLDISSDLDELARTPVAVVCAGPKSILDVAATLEYLETRGRAGRDDRAGRGARLLRPLVGDPLAGPCRGRRRGGGADPDPRRSGPGQRDARVRAGPAGGGAAGGTRRGPRSTGRSPRRTTARIAGPELTPWLLARIAELTDGAAVRANTALIVNNASVAAEIAGRLVA